MTTVLLTTVSLWWRRFLDLVSPRDCEVCGCRLSVTEDGVCTSCLAGLPRTGFWLNASGNPMAQLFWHTVPAERAASFLYYTPSSETSNIWRAFKYDRQPDTAYEMGRVMAHEILPSGFFDGVDVIVPVPLSANHLRRRSYNQSAELAAGISQVTGIPVDSRSLLRTGTAESQTHLTHFDRRQNVDSVFRLSSNHNLSGRHVLLVDDVCTTGATLSACASPLLSAPGVRLSMLTLGFTVS